MDTITHGIVGALAGRAFFAGRDMPAGSAVNGRLRSESTPTARAAITACTLGAIFPDSDVFAGQIARNPLAIMEWHRNITHSLVMLPVWALLLAAVSLPLARWVGWKPPSFAKLVAIYAFGLGSHIFLDVATNFGTMIWSPLNYSRVAWDWLFIVDLGFSGMALLPQFVAWCYREPAKFTRRAGIVWVAFTGGAYAGYAVARAAGFGFPAWIAGAISAIIAAVLYFPALGGVGFRWRRASWCRAGMAALCIYLAFAAISHRRALAYTENFAASRHLRVENLAALPLPPTLTHWTGVITTPEGVWRTTFHVPGGTPERTQLYADAGSDHFVAEAEQLRDVQVYLWFARFPIWQVTQHEGRTVAEVTDVRFFRGETSQGGNDPQQPPRAAAIRTNAAGFTFVVVFDSNGKVISHGFKRPE
jgi:membrane-bound metal-dependent hydrolase YbcI (DUF457 family)